MKGVNMEDLKTMATPYDTSLVCLHCGSIIDAREVKIKRDGTMVCPICKEDICQE
jgi:hypothetical protein